MRRAPTNGNGHLPANSPPATEAASGASGAENPSPTSREITKAGAVEKSKAGWVEENTAILVIHGIGHQKTFETLDRFTRGLVMGFEKYEDFGDGTSKISLEHRLRENPVGERQNKVAWYDNFLRLTTSTSDKHIDIHEYYWAHETEGSTSVADLRNWAESVAKNAKRAYTIDPSCERSDELFFRDGRFQPETYEFVVTTFGVLVPRLETLLKATGRFLSHIPLIRSLPARVESKLEKSMPSLLNVIGDIVVYNTHDKKSRFYKTRWRIKDECYRVLESLIQEVEPPGSWTYGRIVVAGHSLGSQIAYDLFNRLNLLICKGKLGRFESSGEEKGPDEKPTGRVAEDVVSDLITFGSPLDKVAFFLREWTPEELPIRRQMIDNYLCFQAEPTPGDVPKFQLNKRPVEGLLEGVNWTNYYDSSDPVSGHLDFYKVKSNVDCEFYPSADNERMVDLIHWLAKPWVRGTLCLVGATLAALLVMGSARRLWQYFELGPWVELPAFAGAIAGKAGQLLDFLPLFGIALAIMIFFFVFVCMPLLQFARRFSHSYYWGSEDSSASNDMFVDLIKHHLCRS